MMTVRGKALSFFMRLRLGVWFCAFCVVFGLPLIFLYPPFLASDEIPHFYRAYQISELRLVSEAREQESGGMLPSSLSETTNAIRQNIFKTPGFTMDLMESVPRLPLDPDDRTWTVFNNSALYAPLVYLPQAAGIFIGRVLLLQPLTLLYIGRVCSLLAWALMGALALKIAPFFRNVLFILLLTPLVFSKAAVVTADVVTVGVCTLLACQTLKVAYGKNDVAARDVIALLVLAALLGLCKITYAPLAALCFLIPSERLGGKKRFWLICGGAVLLAIAVNLFWTGFLAANIPLQTNASAQPGVQARYILGHPLAFMKIVAKYTYKTLWTNIRALFGATIVWREVHLPFWIIAILWAAVLLAAVTDKPAALIRAWKKACLAALAICVYVIIIASLYLSFSAPMANKVSGMQARYMFPLLLPLLLILKRNKERKIDFTPVFIVVSCVSLAVMTAIMYKRFF